MLDDSKKTLEANIMEQRSLMLEAFAVRRDNSQLLNKHLNTILGSTIVPKLAKVVPADSGTTPPDSSNVVPVTEPEKKDTWGRCSRHW